MRWNDEPRIKDKLTRGRKVSYDEYVRIFKSQPTSKIIKGYNGYNRSFKTYARQELEARGVAESKLPYKRTRSAFGYFDTRSNRLPRNPWDWGW